MSEEYKCDVCGAPATVHLTQIVEGKIHKVHLCEKCAGKSKVAELPILKFTEMLAKTLASGGKKASQEISETEAVGRTPSKICPVCGLTDIVFEKKRLLGCAHCYEIFSEEISALLPKIQPGRKYRGDAEATVKPAKKKKTEKVDPETLRKRLQEAVAKEDYALAASLRDEIRSLEKPGTSKPTKRTVSKKVTAEKAATQKPRKIGTKKRKGGDAA